MSDARRFDHIERVVRDTRRQLDDHTSTVLARLGTHVHAGGGGGAVDSVNGQTGVVVLDAGDVGAQPSDSDLTTIAGLAPADGDLMQRVAGAWANRTIAQVKSDLGLATVATTGAYADLSGAPSPYTDEQVRDVMGAALVAGSGITVTPNDGADTITIAATGGGGVTDHGALTGLSDDDHPQYLLRSLVDAKGDIFAGTANDTVARLAVGTDGQVLAAASAESTGVKWVDAAIGPVYARTTSDTAVTSTTAADIAGLSWSLASGATYVIELTIFYTAGTTGDMGIAFTGPSMTSALMGRIGSATATTTSITTVAFNNMTSFNGVGGDGTANRKIALFRASFVTSAAGTLQARIRQEANDGANATTALAGSWGYLMRIS